MVMTLVLNTAGRLSFTMLLDIANDALSGSANSAVSEVPGVLSLAGRGVTLNDAQQGVYLSCRVACILNRAALSAACHR